MDGSIVYDGVVSPWESTLAVRTVPVAEELVLSSLAGFELTQSDEVSWAEIHRRNGLAKFRAWDGRIPAAQRGSAEMRKVKLPPLSNSLSVSEYETRMKMFAQMQGGNSQFLVDAIYDDTRTIAETFHNRVDKGLAQVLDNDGEFAVDEWGVAFEADYGVPDDNKFTAAVPWTDRDTALVGDDLRAMGRRYRKSAKVPAGQILGTSEGIEAMMGNAQLVAETLGVQSGRTRMSLPDLRTWLTDNGLPSTITEVETTYDNDETGETERALREGKIILAPADMRSSLQWRYGVSTTAFELVESRRTEMSWQTAPGLVLVTVKGGPPFRQYLYGDAVGMPVLMEPKRYVFGNTFAG